MSALSAHLAHFFSRYIWHWPEILHRFVNQSNSSKVLSKAETQKRFPLAISAPPKKSVYDRHSHSHLYFVFHLPFSAEHDLLFPGNCQFFMSEGFNYNSVLLVWDHKYRYQMWNDFWNGLVLEQEGIFKIHARKGSQFQIFSVSKFCNFMITAEHETIP